MKESAFILCSNKDCARKTQFILQGLEVSSRIFFSIDAMRAAMDREGCCVVIVDLDFFPMDARQIRRLAAKRKGLQILCLSESNYHPDLADAFQNHIHACLKKPIDPDELAFWLCSTREKASETSDPPG